MQDKITTQISVITHLKEWNSSKIWENSIDEEIKSRLKSWNAASPFGAKSFLHFLSNNVKIKIYKIIIVNGVLFWRKTRSLSMRNKCMLWRSGVRCCGGIFAPKK